MSEQTAAARSSTDAQVQPPFWDASLRLDQPPRSQRWLGRLLNPVRRWCWRFLGLPTAFDEAQMRAFQLVQLLDHLAESGSDVFRPGTMDGEIFFNVVLRDEYGLPRSLAPDDVIVDVGMHIGSFCLAALLRGSCRVYGFEAEAENFRRAARNLRRFGKRVQLFQKAVWRSDRPGATLRHSGYSEGNTGGGNVIRDNDGQEIETIPFDDVLRLATEEGRRRVRLLKIDCEGSEFPILLTSRLLHWVDSIHGEFHAIGDNISEFARVEGVPSFTREALVGHLERQGFTVTCHQEAGDPHWLGKFFAHRSATARLPGHRAA